MSEISDLIDEFGREIIVTRPPSGDYNDKGKWEQPEGEDITLNIMACIQPVSMVSKSDRFLLPEGVKQEQLRKVYTYVELFTDSEDGKRSADTYEDKGKIFKIIGIGEHDENVLDHFKCFSQLIRIL